VIEVVFGLGIEICVFNFQILKVDS